ncbi:5'-adenylylsulfate reductase-like 5 isoform X1 [Coffea arabica]|uniref:5'-adenylylsulfate reductase-like 5 isoform X1 n=1 Tax=Coffea arabica TaxID=13443 RepID=A0A6P6T3D1_COFAR|nr:5'-adenylylsulfate reductase-like 5 [Coffea arabica]
MVVFLRLAMLLWICICYGVCRSCAVASSSSSPAMCRSPSPQSNPPFLTHLLSQCHLSYYRPNFPVEMNGDSRERALSSKSGNTYTAVLFYASWCPFSQDALSAFEVLGSLYPEIDHLAVEQSSTVPSLFSRYGIHSLPAIIIVSQKSRTRFRGSKDLDSLIKFYKKTTGHEPVQYIAVDQSGNSGSGGKSMVVSRCGSSAKETLTREPYLFFSVLFLSLRVMVYVCPKFLFHSRNLWVSFRPHLNLEIFGGTSEILGMTDFKRVWTKIRLCNHRNFHLGASNARVFASSFASVSLGETSLSKL